MKKSLRTLCVLLLAGGFASRAFAWSHQGHYIITQMACLRILNDPTAPAELKDFIRAETNAQMSKLEDIALHQTLGTPGDELNKGIDGYCTLPDRIQTTSEGRKKIDPYNAPEMMMHFTDLEYFTKDGIYKDDLSEKPKFEDIPHDVKDPRWQRAGFVPLRLEECYKKLVAEFSKGSKMDRDAAAHWAGYLAHYTEDIHQPHHTTVDHKSFSYLAGNVPGVPASVAHKDPRVAHVDKKINPHGDVEFQLFEDDKEPRSEFRKEYWENLNATIETIAKPVQPMPAGKFDPYKNALTIMFNSYDYLPLIGHAAVDGYKSGEFDPQAFFAAKYKVHNKTMSVIDMIARQNAKAVLAVEKVWRQAWADAHPQVAAVEK